MRYPYIMEGRARLNTAAFSLPYFGNASNEIANATVILDANGNKPVYDQYTMGDKIWVDPLSGKIYHSSVLKLSRAYVVLRRAVGSALKFRSDVTRLTPVDQTMLNHPRHVSCSPRQRNSVLVAQTTALTSNLYSRFH